MSTSVIEPPYPFDPTGTQASNLVEGEQHILTGANSPDYYFVVPEFAPFFADTDSLSITYQAPDGTTRPLNEGADYVCTHWFIAASRACAKPIYGSISFLNLDMKGVITLSYQTLGGDWTIDQNAIATILADSIHNPRVTSWDVVTEQPITFPVINHQWDLVDLVGMSEVVAKLNEIETAIVTRNSDAFAQHLNAVNPHHTTASDVGTYSRSELDQKLSYLQFQIDALKGA